MTLCEPLFVRICDFKNCRTNMTLLIYNLVKDSIAATVLCVKKYRGVYKIYLHDEKDKTPLLINGIRY